MSRRFLSSIKSRLLAKRSKRVAVAACGLTCVFEINNQVERFRTEGFGGERSFLEYFLGQIESDDTVFDIGASVGLMTVFAASKVRCVYAFEPDPENMGRL